MSYAHDLARRYNETLASTGRGDEVEWIVDHHGNLKLRDIPERTAARTTRLAQRREADRKRFNTEQAIRDRPFAPAEQMELADAL